MPTPFYHLSIADDLLHHSQLKNTIRRKLVAERGAFLFGNTAPDVQVVSGQARQETHFFTFPFDETKPAWECFFTANPDLAALSALDPDRAAFIAGYICHLQADWFWVQKIYWPYFRQEGSWGPLKTRLYFHNVLRSYYDELALQALPRGMDQYLEQAHPDGWLSFIQDEHLSAWCSFLAQQLHPNGKTRTVQVFAEREGSDPAEFASLLDSEERMEEEVFRRVPRTLIYKYRQELIETNLNYLNICLS